MFKGHSTQWASRSKVDFQGLSLSFLDRVSWSNECTWQKICKKHVVSPGEKLQETLFKYSQ